MSTNPMPGARTLVDLLREQAERYQDKVAFSFSYDGDDENSSQLTYRELDLKARAIAANLQQQGAAGERVLIICGPGLDAIAGFFGCVYAGAVGVLVHQRLAPRLASVVPDVQAGFALANDETQKHVRAAVDNLLADDPTRGTPLRWGVLDAAVEDAEKWTPPEIDAGTVALLQYTSGSTRSPRGIMLTHRNLLHNLAVIREAWHDDDDTIGVYWLPPHHDMGLIGVILERLYAGCTTVLMSPTGFIKNPMRWLQAMSRHRATVTTAPNFAYEICVERSTAEERAALDLSNWSTAMCGAEPIRAATLRAFADAFAPAGFRAEAFHPVYGLAEATLLVSGASDSAELAVQHIDRTALSEDRVVDAAPGDPSAATVVGCGRPLGGQQVIIVDPETCRRCEPDRVGEIWIAGPSVASGYWGRPKETKQAFSAFLAETGSDQYRGPFLRTGDLGFLRSGELFITGRWKDLVVIRRGNHYPNDIEATVQDCHPMLVSGRGAVFSVPSESGGTEQLVVAQEVDRERAGGVELVDVIDTIRAAITERHGLEVDAVLLVEPLRLPTTTSGKIQRGLCRQQFVDRSLEAVVEWYAPLPPADDGVDILAKARTDPEVAARLAALAKLASAQAEKTI